MDVCHTLPLALAALLLLGGCTGGTPTTPAETPTAATTVPSTTEASPGQASQAPADEASDTLTALQASERALEAVPGAVVAMDLGRERGTTVWEVTVLTQAGAGVELYLDARTGEVLRQQDEDLDREERTAPAVTAADAIGTALDARPGRVTELGLDTERGVVVWEVDVATDAGNFEVYIDAASGDIVKNERS